MTTDDRKQDLIKRAAEAMVDYDNPGVYERGDAVVNWDDYVGAARAVLAVFEAAHTPTTPTDDEREALAGLFDDHWMTLLGRCSCGWVHPQFGSRSRDPLYVRQHLADAVVAAGFHRTVQGELTIQVNMDAPIPYVGTSDDFAVNIRVRGEPTDAQVLAALNAMMPYAKTDDLDDWGVETIERMRAALRAAAEEGKNRG